MAWWKLLLNWILVKYFSLQKQWPQTTHAQKHFPFMYFPGYDVMSINKFSKLHFSMLWTFLSSYSMQTVV